MRRRAIGIVRVSVTGGREGESFRSPAEQRSRIEEACERDGLALVDVIEELDVSGGTPLAQREGLRSAVEAVEDGRAEVIVAAYFDRLVRSLRVQEEVVSRIEAAGGGVLAVDVGEVGGSTAAQWLSSTVLGMMSEYYRRSIGERVAGTQAQAVARGVWPSRVPVGYVRGAGGVLVPGAAAAVVRDAFALRADGASLREVRAFLREHGIERSYAGVEKLLRSRAYLGEIHFGELVNTEAHEPLIDADTWRQAQRARASRGRRAKSERLLARLGVLRCATCEARMSVGGRARYPVYRCNNPDCPDHPSVMAHIVEGRVVEAVKARFGKATGRASAEASAQQAAEAAERAQADLDAALRAFVGLEDEAGARERLAELRRVRDETRERADHLGGLHSAATLRLAEDWDRLSLDARRRIVLAAVERVEVKPGREIERVAVFLRE
jgi:DNA invertase Pin-like site-specific DNA recombinase